MKKTILILAILGTLVPSSQAEFAIGFEDSESYFLGDIVNQGSGGSAWELVNGRANIIAVAADFGKNGSNGITGQSTGSGSNYVYYRYEPTAKELGGEFNPATSILHYSFDVRINEDFGSEANFAIITFGIGGRDKTSSDSVMLIELRNSGRIAANYGGTGDANSWTGQDHQIAPKDFTTISGIVNFREGYFTVELNGMPMFQQVQGGSLAFRMPSDRNPSIIIGNLNAGDNSTSGYLSWSVDNIKLSLGE